jgi:3-dehydroquinate synthetase
MANTTPSLLEVKLAERSYPIVFAGAVGPEIRRAVGELTQAGRRVAVITDVNVAGAQPQLFEAFGDAARFEVAPGEGAKSPEVLASVWNFLAKERIDRTGALFVVGGGVVGDLGGFAAASWLRGIEFYQVPTTLLAMVDSSVGGKTGINIPAGKNLVGAFHQPRAVFIGTDLLATW